MYNRYHLHHELFHGRLYAYQHNSVSNEGNTDILPQGFTLRRTKTTNKQHINNLELLDITLLSLY